MKIARFLIVFLLSAGFVLHAAAQTRENGPWWPHPIWGKDDQSGGSNWITPEKVLKALTLVKTGQIYEIGQVYSADMPLFGQRTYSMVIPGSPSGGPMGSNNLVYYDEFLVAEIGQVGTQFDGPGHIGERVRMEDGTEKDVFYNGFTNEEIKGLYGLVKLGVENVGPFITRGILVDVAAYKGVESLDHGYEVTVEDVQGALARQGIAEDSLEPGDAYFFRYGWARHWNDHDTYNTNPPGIGLAVARWVVDRKASMIGSDQWTTEVVPNPDVDMAFPVHQELITRNGVWNLENMNLDGLSGDGVYEFLFIHTPIRFKGATGSPARPIAIR